MRKADNLSPSCAFVTKSGNLNFLEPFGPLQACNGTALPFYLYDTVKPGRQLILVLKHILLLLQGKRLSGHCALKMDLCGSLNTFPDLLISEIKKKYNHLN